MPNPLPDVMPYPLRPDEFLTCCEGEMSGARSIRDGCIGAVVTGMVGIAGILLTIDWDAAEKQGRHPFLVTLILSTLTLSALAVGLVENKRMKQTKTKSSYSRVIQTIATYFRLPAPS
jgi:hypothetical protein